eukprot:CAMPEP_0201172352 /NCGR_PEP_ID=MMETSP0851-20130426/91537_1 /ASSEMBLY_ACC=CAM_ASM_000631 /TAXON_ID=183588 /ORGANISM="Pseudo-nitzschia fraudulenta, Strain WWA7" /LENGTH=85 /DNA_ID=CAMNT_0047454865 /DNA_START=29 /DNA_END=284 /DNA_ORIENTATION=+
MTRRTAREPEDDRDDRFVFRKKRKLISGSMMEKGREGKAQAGTDQTDEDHQVTGPDAGWEPKRRSASSNVENHQPLTHLARKPDA